MPHSTATCIEYRVAKKNVYNLYIKMKSVYIFEATLYFPN
jgi:hypothetical protein